LQQVNKSKEVLTERSLRHTLDRMQVSLIKHNTEEIYLRSTPGPNEGYLQQKMGVAALLPIMPKAKLRL
jgi:hypothetical protein